MKNYQKAIAAVLSNAILLGGAIGLNIELSPEFIATIATLLNGVLVWAVPNKPA